MEKGDDKCSEHCFLFEVKGISLFHVILLVPKRTFLETKKLITNEERGSKPGYLVNLVFLFYFNFSFAFLNAVREVL